MSSSYVQLIDPDPDFCVEHPPTSPTLQLALEVAYLLERKRNFKTSSDLLARALAYEALLANQQVLTMLDLTDDTHAAMSKSLHTAMMQQRHSLQSLTAPRLRPSSPQNCASRCAAVLGLGHASNLPKPTETLDALARRWYLAQGAVHSLWEEFVVMSGGNFHLSQRHARVSLLGNCPDEASLQASWGTILLDASASELVATEDELEDVFGINFEEFIIARSFDSASHLEDQYRFLWALLDRDGDKVLTKEELCWYLQIPRARLGWDDAYTREMAELAFDMVAPKMAGGIRDPELLAALMERIDLRQLLMTKEPRQPAVNGESWVGDMLRTFKSS